MSKTLYLMRHGETLFNELGLIQGWCDSPLTENGKEQARAAYDFFKNEGISFDKHYCSTAERTSDTLEIVSPHAQYQRLKGLKELYFGRMEGKPEYLHPNLEQVQGGPGDFYLEYDGETQSELIYRVSRALTAIVDQASDGDNILVVSHAGAIMSFFAGLELSEHPKLHFSNCCIFKYEVYSNHYDLVQIIDPVSKQVYNK